MVMLNKHGNVEVEVNLRQGYDVSEKHLTWQDAKVVAVDSQTQKKHVFIILSKNSSFVKPLYVSQQITTKLYMYHNT